MSVLRRVSVAAVIAGMLACGGEPGPRAGTLNVNLVTPNNGQDGAVILVITAPEVPTSVMAGAGLTLWGGPITTTTSKIVLTGTLSTGTILTLDVDNVFKASQYHVQVQEVSQTNYQLRTPLAGYSATVTR
jgi:hypothetical protein